jgi:hypothetical protein
MQKNVMMIVVAIVAIIAIVAVVLLMGNKGTTATPVTPGGGTALPITPGGGTTPPAITGNTICDISGNFQQADAQISFSGTMKYESPDKANMDLSINANGVAVTMKQIVNGQNAYAQMPGFGWVQMDLNDPEMAAQFGSDASDYEGKSTQEIEDSLKADVSGQASGIMPTITCRATGDIPDSEFQLPPGTQAKTWDEYVQAMTAALGG